MLTPCRNFSLMHPRDRLVEIMQRIYDYSMTTTSGGDLSLLDSDGDMWITPAGIDKGTLVPEDMVCVTKDGNIIGRHKPSSEYPFHQTIYQRNNHVKAILHAHPPALAAFSVIRQIPNTLVIPQAADVCGKVGIAKYATPGTQELADNITESLNDGYDIVLLENHGIVAIGPDLLTAFQRFETLDFCARIIIRAGLLHNSIYEAHPEICAITTAQPPNIMAYGITDTELDTKTLPENYILLRSIPLLKYGIEFTDGVASIVSKQTPVVIFQNDAILATGSSILKAFDRLEVAERAAQTVLYSLSLGNIVPLNREQVGDLERKFPVN